MKKGWTYREVIRAIELAERQVRYEIILQEGAEKRVPEPIRQMCANSLDLAKRKVQRNILATELLSQAYIIVEQRQAREKAIEVSIIGGLKDTLEHLSMVLQKMPIIPNPPYPFDAIKNKEIQKDLRITWAKLCKTARKKQMRPTLDHLINILNSAIADLIYKDFPSLPSLYRIGQKTYSKKEVN